MKISFIIDVLLFFVLFSCDTNDDNFDRITLEYDNILIFSDVSNRILGDQNDINQIESILDYFVSNCVKPGIKINDRSSLRFYKIGYSPNNCETKEIDLESFQSLEQKQKYVNNNNGSGGLTLDLKLLLEGINCTYEKADQVQPDVITMISIDVSNGDNIKHDKAVFDGQDSIFFKYNNRLVVFTDGYLGYSGQEIDGDFQIGPKELDDIRKLCRANDMNVYDLLKICPELRIRPFKHANNALVDLYVLETDDQGFDPITGNFSNPGPLSDNNILKAFWEFWAAESGYKSLTWKPISRSRTLTSAYIDNLFNPVIRNTTENLFDDLIPFASPGRCPELSSSPQVEAMPEVKERNIKKLQNPIASSRPVPESQVVNYERIRKSTIIRDADLLSHPDPSTIVKKVPRGKLLDILGYGGGYYRVLVDGERGYMLEQHVKTYKNEAW